MPLTVKQAEDLKKKLHQVLLSPIGFNTRLNNSFKQLFKCYSADDIAEGLLNPNTLDLVNFIKIIKDYKDYNFSQLLSNPMRDKVFDRLCQEPVTDFYSFICLESPPSKEAINNFCQQSPITALRIAKIDSTFRMLTENNLQESVRTILLAQFLPFVESDEGMKPNAPQQNQVQQTHNSCTTLLEALLKNASDDIANHFMASIAELPIAYRIERPSSSSLYSVVRKRLQNSEILEEDGPRPKKIKLSHALQFQLAIDQSNWNAAVDIIENSDQENLKEISAAYFQNPKNSKGALFGSGYTKLGHTILDNYPNALLIQYFNNNENLILSVHKDNESIIIRILHLFDNQSFKKYIAQLSSSWLVNLYHNLAQSKANTIFDIIVDKLDSDSLHLYFPFQNYRLTYTATFEKFYLEYFSNCSLERKMKLLRINKQEEWTTFRHLAISTTLPPRWSTTFNSGIIDLDISNPLPGNWTALHLYARYRPSSFLQDILMQTSSISLNKALKLRINDNPLHSLLSLVIERHSDSNLLTMILEKIDSENMSELWMTRDHEQSLFVTILFGADLKVFKLMLDKFQEANLLEKAFLENPNIAFAIAETSSQVFFDAMITKCSPDILYKLALIKNKKNRTLLEVICEHRTYPMLDKFIKKAHQPHLEKPIAIDTAILLSACSQMKVLTPIVTLVRDYNLNITLHPSVNILPLINRLSNYLTHIRDKILFDKLYEILSIQFTPHPLAVDQFPVTLWELKQLHPNNTVLDILKKKLITDKPSGYEILLASQILTLEEFARQMSTYSFDALIESGQLFIAMHLIQKNHRDYHPKTFILELLTQLNTAQISVFITSIMANPAFRKIYFDALIPYFTFFNLMTKEILQTLTQEEVASIQKALTNISHKNFYESCLDASHLPHSDLIITKLNLLSFMSAKLSSAQFIEVYNQNKNAFQTAFVFINDKGLPGFSYLFSLNDVQLHILLKDLNPEQIKIIASNMKLINIVYCNTETITLFFDIFKDYINSPAWQQQSVNFLIAGAKTYNSVNYRVLLERFSNTRFPSNTPEDIKDLRKLLNAIVCFQNHQTLEMFLKACDPNLVKTLLLNEQNDIKDNVLLLSRSIYDTASPLQYASLYSSDETINTLLEYIDSAALLHMLKLSHSRDALMQLCTDLFINNPCKAPFITQVHAKLLSLFTPEIIKFLSHTIMARLKEKEELGNKLEHLKNLQTALTQEGSEDIHHRLLNIVSSQINSIEDEDDHEEEEEEIHPFIQKLHEKMTANQLHIKIITQANHPKYVEALKDYSHRSKLRYLPKGQTTTLFKYHHMTAQILPYVNHRLQPKVKLYAYTSKSSATEINARGTTPVFGHHDYSRSLVGYFYDGDTCKIKAMFNTDVGTVQKYWYAPDERTAELYAKKSAYWSFTDKQAFHQNINESHGKVNELLAQVKRESLLAIVICRYTEDCRALAKERQILMVQELNLNLPIVFYDARTPTLKMVKDVMSPAEIQSLAVNPQPRATQ